MKTSLLYISPSILPSEFANSVHVMKMCSAFARNGINVELLGKKGIESGNIYDAYNVDNNFRISVSNNNNKFLAFFKYNLLIFKKVRKHEGVVFLRYWYALIWCMILKKEFIFELHGIPKNKLQKFVFKKAFKSKYLIQIVFITENLKTICADDFRLTTGKSVILPDCCDIPINKKVNKPFDVGYVGHLYKGRGIEIIIELAKDLPNTRFHIIGGREKEINYFKTRSTDNIKYYGFVNQNELSSLYNSFSIALAPYQEVVGGAKKSADTSKWMSPMKIFEYMAYKKAIILSDLPVLHEIGINNQHFLFAKCDDIQVWKNGIIELQNNPKLMATLIDNSHNHFLENFTWDSRAQKIIKIIKS